MLATLACLWILHQIYRIDQVSVVLRYVCPKDGKPVERFLNFLVLKSHAGEDMANDVFICVMYSYRVQTMVLVYRVIIEEGT